MAASRPNVVDSSGWLAYFAAEPSAPRFAGAIEDTARLIVPSICLFEVVRVFLGQRGEEDALRAAGAMKRGRVVDLDAELSITAARLGEQLKLPLADSVVYATARQSDAILWTQDSDFKGLEDVRYFPKSGR